MMARFPWAPQQNVSTDLLSMEFILIDLLLIFLMIAYTYNC